MVCCNFSIGANSSFYFFEVGLQQHFKITLNLLDRIYVLNIVPHTLLSSVAVELSSTALPVAPSGEKRG